MENREPTTYDDEIGDPGHTLTTAPSVLTFYGIKLTNEWRGGGGGGTISRFEEFVDKYPYKTSSAVHRLKGAANDCTADMQLKYGGLKAYPQLT